MVKSTKRSRKFVAKGGAKAMLEKGTITKKGKLKMKKRRTTTKNSGNVDGGAGGEMSKNQMERQEKRREEDFVGRSNLGDLDLDDFLKSVAESDDVDGDLSSNGDGDIDEDDDSESEDGDDGTNDDTDDNEDGGSDGEDEDVETAERRMKEEMTKLAESDPDFHQYLQENESSLLEFENNDEDDVRDSDDDVEEAAMEVDNDGGEETNAKPKKKKTGREGGDDDDAVENSNEIELNAKLLKTYEQSAFNSHGVKGLKRIISAYRSACHMGDPNEEQETISSSTKKIYHIESSVVFDKLMVLCLKHCHEEFHYHLIGKGSGVSIPSSSNSNSDDNDDDSKEEFDENSPINPRQLAKSVRWLQLKPAIQTFLKATLHIMSQASPSSSSSKSLLTFILKSLSKYLPYTAPFPRIAKAFLKTLTSLWSATQDSSPNYQIVRLQSFLRLRQLTLTQPFPFIELCLKSTYLAYAKRAKFANAATITSLLPTITFMGNCVVELFSLDYASSYQHSFVYIRQLALHLRTALQKKTPDSFRVVYCWQYMHCLKLWTAVLSSASLAASKVVEGDREEVKMLRSLIYPLTEIIFGVARLIPTTRHLPLRLHCVRLLQQLAASSEQYIPTTSILLETLDLKEISMKPKRVKKRGEDVRGVRLPVVLKLPKVDALRTMEQLDACLSEVFCLLNREVELYKYSAGFPEFTIRICQRLRKFSKETKNGKYRAYARGCIELCEKYSSLAVKARSLLEEAPKDVKRLEVLKPIDVPSMAERYETAVAKEKRLEAVSQPALSEAVKAKTRIDGKAEKDDSDKNDGKKKSSKNKEKKIKLNENDLKNVSALEEVDEVQEGIDWSDDEDDVGAGEDDSASEETDEMDDSE